MSWEYVRLKDIATIIMGQSPESEYFNSEGEGMPFMQGKTEFGEFYPSIVKYTTKTTRVANNNSILFTVRAPVGALNIANQDICIGRGLASIDSNDGDNYFLYYLIKNHHSLFLSESGEGVYDSINKTNLNNVKLFIPSNVDLRKKIGAILSAYDDLIENNLKRIKLLEQAAQNIYKEWFVHLRFPGYENTSINEETGLPEGWFSINLGEISLLKYGKMPKSEKKTDKGFVIYTGYRKVGFYKEKMFDEPTLIVVARGVGGTGDVKISPRNCWLTNLSIAIVNKKDLAFQAYLYYFLKFANLRMLDSGAAQSQITINALEKVKVILPILSLQKEFQKKYDDTSKMIENLNLQNQKLKAARDILLPRLMNRTIEV